MSAPASPRLSAQFERTSKVVPDYDAPIREACVAAGPMWQAGGKHFEKARRIVAKKLRWKPHNVMDWEVRSYFRLDRPDWIEREGLVLP